MRAAAGINLKKMWVGHCTAGYLRVARACSVGIVSKSCGQTKTVVPHENTNDLKTHYLADFSTSFLLTCGPVDISMDLITWAIHFSVC